MDDTGLPTEVELVFEVMPCNALRTAQEPEGRLHPCTYFRKWGTYHSYDYTTDDPPPGPGIVHKIQYVGRAPLVPELLSGCRKAPIMAVGINPNLPGWSKRRRGSLNPLFDNFKQYAHYFRYRAVSKLEIPPNEYEQLGGGPHDTPFSGFELNVPLDENGVRTIPVQLQPQKMYQAYQALLDSLADRMGWQDHRLAVGEDLSYGNMVASPSARWTTRVLEDDPDVPPMTEEEREGIVGECFHKRKYFLRQLFQSLPSVLLVFSQSTANALIGELQSRFVVGNPQVGEPIADLMEREVRLRYGDLPDGSVLEARVIFAPHITGTPEQFEAGRQRVVDQLVEEVQAGRLRFNPNTKHLARTLGGCLYCTMLEIGPCEYRDELQTLATVPALAVARAHAAPLEEKSVQQSLMGGFLAPTTLPDKAWTQTDDTGEPAE